MSDISTRPPAGTGTITAALGPSTVLGTSAGDVRVYERGRGRPIVFVHGMSVNAAAWRKVVPLLADRYRCITVDWPFGAHRIAMAPGADLSSTGIADLVAEVLERLELTDVTLVGNDGGGMLCQLLVTRRPERVGRLVLTNCDAYENFPPRQFAYLCRLARFPVTLRMFSRALAVGVVRRGFTRSRFGFGGLSHVRPDDELIDHYVAGIRENPAVVRDFVTFLASVDRRDTLEAAKAFPAVTMPVLIAWATDDRYFPMRDARRFARDFPNARLVRIERSRTWVAEDRPEELAELIGGFVN